MIPNDALADGNFAINPLHFDNAADARSERRRNNVRPVPGLATDGKTKTVAQPNNSTCSYAPDPSFGKANAFLSSIEMSLAA